MNKKFKNLKFLIVILIFGFYILNYKNASAATIIRPPLNVGLVGYWDMETGKGTNKTHDKSGNANTGTLTSMNTATAWVDGPTGRGQALSFDGTDDYVDLGDTSVVDFGSGNYAFSAWIKPTLATTGFIIGKDDDVNGRQFTFSIFSNGDSYMQLFYGPDTPAAQNTVYKASSAVQAAVWQHIVGQRNGNQFEIYVNGVNKNATYDSSISAADFPQTMQAVAASLNIGRRSYSTSRLPFPGSIDDVRIYNRALSASEIERLYKTQKSKTSPKSPLSFSNTLTRYWNFDFGKGKTTAYDQSGNGGHGTLTGMNPNTSWVQSKDGLYNALDFDTTNYVTINSVPDITGTKTVSLWFKAETFPNNGLGKALFYANNTLGSPATDPIIISVQNPTSQVFQLAFGCGDSGGKYGITVSTQTWYHAVIVKSGGTCTAYVNGAIPSASSGNIFTSGQIEAAYIGAVYNGSLGANFDGIIDDVRIFNKALTASEVKQLYNFTNPKIGVPQISNGLVGYWDFNTGKGTNKAYDRSGNNNTGTLTSMNTATAWVDGPTGKMGQALSFDGTDDYVDVGDKTNLTFGDGTTDTPFTISAWINRRSSGTFPVVSKYIDATTGFEYRLIIASDLLYINTYDLSALAYVGRNYSVALPTGEWQHVVGTYNGNAANSGFALYVNSARVDDTNFSGGTYTAMENTNAPFNIATEQNTLFASGSIDDVRIYNRALSGEEVRRLYNIGR